MSTQTFYEKNLFSQISNLIAGTLYNVQVTPVKCNRSLNPQSFSFYTIPSAIRDLTVVEVTTSSLSLNWSKPEGNCDSYSVYLTSLTPSFTDKKTIECSTNACSVTNLKSGVQYNITITAKVNDTIEGVPFSASHYTKPSKISSITPENNSSKVIKASWTKPDGYQSGFEYCLKEAGNISCQDCNIQNCDGSSNCTISRNCSITTDLSMEESGKSAGTMYCLCVTPLTNDNSLAGETTVTSTYTEPNTVNLSLTPDSKSIFSNWTIAENYQSFQVSIRESESNNILQSDKTENLYYTFQGLHAAVNYTVTVTTVNGDLKSDVVTVSIFTKPTKPESCSAKGGQAGINVTYVPPIDSGNSNINYSVKYISSFWKEENVTYTNKTNINIPNLQNGTTYRIEVRVVAGSLMSDPCTAEAQTEPEKMTLTLIMMCSSIEPLYCGKITTKDDMLKKLTDLTNPTLNGVYWGLKWVNRN
ncbi:hypothetical protein DNTS_013902 [Danionella cerebrum]|uniref:Fibronectin type-III domain-containing protein n=1 Tax=Danionella cerebrum TaxID=2873325 RepID=A0A553RPK6_9TELE|nr:hypothetical protein DNTS_013902 [Danionella translucida]